MTAVVQAIARGNLNPSLEELPGGEWQPLVAALRELTENLKAEFQKAFSQSAALRNLFESIPVAMLKWSTRGELLLANRSALSLWGYADRDELLKQCRVQDLFAQPEELKRLMRDAAEIGSITEFELTIQTKGGESRLVSSTAAPLRDEDKAVSSFVSAFREISGQRAMEAQLVQMEKLESISSFASGLAHDFNNILCGIVPNLELLRPQMADKTSGSRSMEKELQMLDSIEKATQMGMTLSKQLMSFSRKSQAHMTVLNLNTVVKDSLQHLRESLGAGIQIEAQLAEDLWNIEADRGQLEEILIHLGKNAQQAMKGDGTLQVTTRNANLDLKTCPRIHGLSPGPYVELRVSDSGSGISPEHLHRIFDPFFDPGGKGQGMGLALSLVFGMVKNHQGSIDVESQANRGSTFRIYFPQTRKFQVLDVPAQPTVSRKKERILVVDDESLVREAISRLLLELGYGVTAIQDGDEALTRFSQGEQYDLVILDMQMPRLDGQETLTRLRDIDPALKVILTSGHCPPENAGDLLERNRCGFLQKPFRLADISKAVRSMLDSTSASH